MDNLTDQKAEGFTGQRLYRLPKMALQRVRQRPFTRDFIVTDLGYFPTVEHHSVARPKGVRQWILIFVHEGEGWYASGHARQEVRSNEVLLIPPERAHAYGANSRAPWSIFWFHFEGAGTAQLLDWIVSKSEPHVMPCRAPDALRRQFHSILAAVERGYHEHTLLELSRVLINALTLLHRNPASEPSTQPLERIESAMDRMRQDIDKPRPLGHYAAASGLSVSQFSHLFKQHTGVSPMHYQTEVRMQRACEYLDTTVLSVKDIAWRLGYDDPLYFSRAFKKCTGLSPTQYQKRI
jgi:AraC-like DNA-binding protein